MRRSDKERRGKQCRKECKKGVGWQMGDVSKKVEWVLAASNAAGRNYVYSPETEDGVEMTYNYFDDAIMNKWYAAGEYGTISDAMILYVIMITGAASPPVVSKIIELYGNANKLLSVTRSTDVVDAVESRIRALTKVGMLYRHAYKVEDGGARRTVTLYGCPKAAQTFANVKLSKKVPVHTFEIASPLNSIISEGAVAYALSRTVEASGCRLLAFAEKNLRSSELGSFFLSPRTLLETPGGERRDVLFYPAFLSQVPRYQTEIDFENALKNKVTELKNYFYSAKKREETEQTYCVIVCEDAGDLNRTLILIRQTHVLTDFGNLPYSYLTSEGALRAAKDVRNAFLQLEEKPDGDLYFVQRVPEFFNLGGKGAC